MISKVHREKELINCTNLRIQLNYYVDQKSPTHEAFNLNPKDSEDIGNVILHYLTAEPQPKDIREDIINALDHFNIVLMGNGQFHRLGEGIPQLTTIDVENVLHYIVVKHHLNVFNLKKMKILKVEKEK